MEKKNNFTEKLTKIVMQRNTPLIVDKQESGYKRTNKNKSSSISNYSSSDDE